MPYSLKRRAAFFIILALIAAVAIAAALPRLELQPGIPLPDQTGGGGESTTNPQPLAEIHINTLAEAILGVVLLLILLYSLYQALKGVPWKEILGPSLTAAALAIAILVILFSLSGAHIQMEPSQPEILPPALERHGPPFGPLPPWLLWLVWIGLGGAALFLGIRWIYFRAQTRQTGERLKLEAERAIRDLKMGSDLRSVIIRCYLQMSLVLQEDRGISRQENMTAREFERMLEDQGVPSEPVHNLTLLFEAARYGSRQPGLDEEQKALDSLNAIVRYSRGKKPERKDE